MRDRLIELLGDFVDTFDPELWNAEGLSEKFADYLLANGVIVPPCKVGQVVYVLRSQTSNGKNLYLREERVDHYRVFDGRTQMCFESDRLSVADYLWDKTVFLTREDAEKALKGERE